MNKQFILTTINTLLKGVGQIMLQENAWTGLLFLAGIFYGSWLMGIATIVAVLVGTCTAKILKYDEKEINSGLYGFSAALVGVAMFVFFQPSFVIWIALCFGSMLAAILQHFFIVKKIPAFTFPFILVTWLLLFALHYFPQLAQPQIAGGNENVDQAFLIFPHAIGQVIFQGSVVSGILFLIGVLIHRPLAVVCTLLATALSAGIAYYLKVPLNDIYLGLLSYNAVLCAMVFTGKALEHIVLTFVSVTLSVLATILMRKLGLVALTFPFVLATWIALLIKYGIEKEQKLL